jgi:hypothetical protein
MPCVTVLCVLTPPHCVIVYCVHTATQHIHACPRYRPKIYIYMHVMCACAGVYHRAFGCISPLRLFAHVAKEITALALVLYYIICTSVNFIQVGLPGYFIHVSTPIVPALKNYYR